MDFLDRFREALKIPTWWPAGAPPGDAAAEAPLLRFQEFLVEAFPVFHKIASRRVLSPYAVLYRWPGEMSNEMPGEKNAGPAGAADGRAALFLAHYDVVAAETGKQDADPFGAEMKDGFIYGRGSLDMKAVLISLMEAAETLCSAGYRPKRDIWFVFGGDEERTGLLGALEAAKWCAEQGLRFSWVLDEGTPIGEEQIKGSSSPMALVSIEEKGYLSLELGVEQEPGHASRPPKIQAAAVLARALCRIEKKPFPFKLIPTVERFFREAAPFAPGVRGFVMRHAKAFGPLFFRAAASTPSAVSMLRTTVAMTQLEGSAAENVLPSKVRGVINLRLLQPWTAERAAAFIKKAVNDERVSVKIRGRGFDPVPAKSGFDRDGWPEIKAALAEAWPGVPMLPFIMVALTDSRHFKDLSGGIFRFNPYKLSPGELAGIHGRNERISLENLRRGLRFYTALLGSL